MIDFELSPVSREIQKTARETAEKTLRPYARYYDDNEHADIKEEEEIIKARDSIGLKTMSLMKENPDENASLHSIIVMEENNWGDAGLSLAVPGMGLGNAAIAAVATPEQKERFGTKYTAMAITEPCCGSDTASIQATAKLDGDEWVINGEKIFVTGGDRCAAVVVWASLDRSQGRPAIKSFVVEKGTPGMTVTKCEHKLGIKASDTAAIVFDDCRIPKDNILGSAEIKQKGGFKGVMKTFDMTRPFVAIQAIGVARAALDFTKKKLEEEGYTFPYICNQHELSVVQKAMMDMEANLEVARLLTYKATDMLFAGLRNSVEASCSKAKAGRAATLVTQKCVELLGPLGYSREWLVEKWMRDCKITDLFEGTGQIQMLIIARNILGFSRDQLK